MHTVGIHTTGIHTTGIHTTGIHIMGIHTTSIQTTIGNKEFYRVRQLILMHFRRTFLHDLMTLYSKVNNFWDPEIGRFDKKHYFFTSLTSHGLHDLRRKRYKRFEEMWAWGPHGYATPLSLRLKVAEYQGFHMGYIFFLY